MKRTRTALLMSVLALLLCASMFVGSTFAWFTDSVSSTNNIITAGNLDVTLEYYDEVQQKWVAVDANQSVFDETTLWEPGHVEVVALRIANVGTLALEYNLSTIVAEELASTNVYGNEFKLSDYLVVRGGAFDDEATALAKIADRATVRTLSDGYAFGADLVDKASLLEKGDADYFVLAVEMPETVGNEANHKTGVAAPKITFGITVVATQEVKEEDSFDNTYDENATYPVASVAEFKNVIAAGGNVILANDLAVADEVISVPAGKSVTVDLNGNTLSGVYNGTKNQEMFLVKGDMTVSNGTIELEATQNQGWDAMATVFDVTAGGVLNLEGVTANVSGTDMNFVVHLNNWGSATLNVNDCDFTTTYVAVRVFNSGYDMNNVTIKNTDFHNGRAFWVHNYTYEGQGDATLNLDIYNNGNTSDNAKPVRFGFSNSVYYDINGNLIP